MGAYGLWDYATWDERYGYVRFRCYNDGSWLEGYDVEPVIYWGA